MELIHNGHAFRTKQGKVYCIAQGYGSSLKADGFLSYKQDYKAKCMLRDIIEKPRIVCDDAFVQQVLAVQCRRRLTLFEARKIKSIFVRKQIHNQSPQITKGKVITDDTYQEPECVASAPLSQEEQSAQAFYEKYGLDGD